MCGPNIWKQSNRRFWHRELIILSRNPVRVVGAQTHARPHAQAIGQRYDRLGKAFEQPIERILTGEERFRSLDIAACFRQQGLDVAAGTKGTTARRRECYDIDVRIARDLR